MDREEFFKGGKKVLTDDEWSVIASTYDKSEDAYNDILENLRECVKGVMAKLWEKRSCTEFTTDRFTIINRFGDIAIIDKQIDSTDETSIDDVNEFNVLMDIVGSFV